MFAEKEKTNLHVRVCMQMKGIYFPLVDSQCAYISGDDSVTSGYFLRIMNLLYHKFKFNSRKLRLTKADSARVHACNENTSLLYAPQLLHALRVHVRFYAKYFSGDNAHDVLRGANSTSSSTARNVLC